MSFEPRIILAHLKDYVAEPTPEGINHEYIFYRFCTDVIENNKDLIENRLRNILSKIIILIKKYLFEKKLETNELVHEVFITMILTGSGPNTGSILDNWDNVQAVITDGNLRELFYVLDEFIHNGCNIMSWFLYERYQDNFKDIPNLNHTFIDNKIKQIAQVIGINPDQKHIQKEIYNLLNKSKSSNFIKCQLWNNKSNSVPTIRMQSIAEYLRYSQFLNYIDIFCMRSTDDKMFVEKKMCSDYYLAYPDKFPTFNNKIITSPPLSKREEEWCRKYNPNYDFDGIIPWKSGCCIYQPVMDSVIGKVSKVYKNANRVTSYSGHTILDLDLFRVFDDEFDYWKEVYVISIMYVMIPYGHHSAHEILSPATYFGIKYSLNKSTETQINDLMMNKLGELVSGIDIRIYQSEYDDVVRSS